ncbi:MAG: phage tail tube protein [Alphaproteobacteria bacterium]
MARWKRQVMLFEAEATYGVDPTPAGADNAVLFEADAELTPLGAEYVNRNLVKVERGTDPMPVVGEHIRVNFAIEAAGAGGVATAPKYGPLLRACGLAETITPTTGPVDYDPISASDESGTLYFNRDGTNYKLTGCRGSVALELTRRQVPKWRFAIIGLYNAPAAVALPSAAFTGWQAGIPATIVNTPTFSLHAHSPVFASLTLDLANDVRFRDLIGTGGRSIEIIDRNPVGQVVIEAPALGSKDYHAICKSGATGALSLVHGTSAGQKVLAAAPAVQLTNPRPVDLDGMEGLQMDLMLHRDEGDDEVVFSTQ